MISGVFSYVYKGDVGVGLGLFKVADGLIEGGDLGGLIYRGRFEEVDGGKSYKVSLSMTVPAGTFLVMGTSPLDIDHRREVELSIPREFFEGTPTVIDVPPGKLWMAAQEIPTSWAAVASVDSVQHIARVIGAALSSRPATA